jgi:hypothetical protein
MIEEFFQNGTPSNNDNIGSSGKLRWVNNAANISVAACLLTLTVFVGLSMNFVVFDPNSSVEFFCIMNGLVVIALLSIPFIIYFTSRYLQVLEEEKSKRYYYVISNRTVEFLRKDKEEDLATYLEETYGNPKEDSLHLENMYLKKNGEKFYVRDVSLPPDEWLMNIASAKKWKVYSTSLEAWIKNLEEEEFTETQLAVFRQKLTQYARRELKPEQTSPPSDYEFVIDRPVARMTGKSRS